MLQHNLEEKLLLMVEVSKVCGGGGGGRADMATAGGRDLGKVSEALKTLEGLI